MAQSNNDDYEFSLFPFMGVLAGVIGTLVLVISGLAIIGMSQSTVSVSLEGGSKDQLPICLECADNEIVIHHENGQQVISDLSENHDQLREILAELKRRDATQFLVLLIRPDAIPTFFEVEPVVVEFEFNYGYDVLLSEEKVQFSS